MYDMELLHQGWKIKEEVSFCVFLENTLIQEGWKSREEKFNIVDLLQEAFYQYPIHSRKIKYAVSFHQLKFDEASRGMNSLEEEHTQMMDIKRKSVYQFIIMVL